MFKLFVHRSEGNTDLISVSLRSGKQRIYPGPGSSGAWFFPGGNAVIYMDNAATTAVLPEVMEEMLPWFCGNYGNPSGVYRFAGEAKEAVERARDRTAALIGAESREIFFTGGGSESDNWALKSVFEERRSKGKHIIVSKIEHHAILHTAQWLEGQGAEVTYLDPDPLGRISPESVEAAIRPDTILISVMAANNEIGTIEPVAAIGETARKHHVLFHTDAVQAFGHIPLDVNAMKIDLLSASGHKLHGPKGVGILYIRKGVKIGSFIHGGSQERGRRAGTYNVPGIVGMGKAAELAGIHLEEWAERQREIRDYLIRRLESEIPCVQLNGDRVNRLPNNVNLSVRFTLGESLLLMLDRKGICASSGSACTAGSVDPSHVLTAVGCPKETAQSALRLTISEATTMEEADTVVEELKQIAERLREHSPLYAEHLKSCEA